jgi:hypothetical protein
MKTPQTTHQMISRRYVGRGKLYPKQTGNRLDAIWSKNAIVNKMFPQNLHPYFGGMAETKSTFSNHSILQKNESNNTTSKNYTPHRVFFGVNNISSSFNAGLL